MGSCQIDGVRQRRCGGWGDGGEADTDIPLFRREVRGDMSVFSVRFAVIQM